MCLSEYWGSTHKVHEEWLTSHARPQCASGRWRMFSGQDDGTEHLWWMVCHEHKLRATKNMAHLKVVVGQGEVDLRMCETFVNDFKMYRNVSWDFACVIHLQKKSEKTWAPRQCCRPDLHPLEQSYQGQMVHRPPSRDPNGTFQLNQAQLFDMKCGCYWSFCLAQFFFISFVDTTTVYLKILSSPRVRNWDHPYASCPYSTPLGQGAAVHSRLKKTNAADESKLSACQLEIPAESTATTHAINPKSPCQNKT